MNDRPFSPEEFVRLLALPEDDPERRQAEASGKLDAWRRMLREFEEPGPGEATAGELAGADAALGRHVESMLGTPAGGHRSAPRAAGPGLLAWLASIWSRPALRPAFALAALVIVGGAGWWLAGERVGRGERAVRGVAPEAAIVVEARATPGALDLTWGPVAGAERYRVRFYGPSLSELDRRDDVTEPHLRLEPGTLPRGTASGQEILVEVVALRGGDAIAVSAPKAVRLP